MLLPQRFTHSDRIQNFATAKSQAIIEYGKLNPANLLKQLGFNDVEVKDIDQTDGLRFTLADQQIVHLRPSGNAPELRCYAVAATYSAASEYVIKSLKNIQNLQPDIELKG